MSKIIKVGEDYFGVEDSEIDVGDWVLQHNFEKTLYNTVQINKTVVNK